MHSCHNNTPRFASAYPILFFPSLTSFVSRIPIPCTSCIVSHIIDSSFASRVRIPYYSFSRSLRPQVDAIIPHILLILRIPYYLLLLLLLLSVILCICL